MVKSRRRVEVAPRGSIETTAWVWRNLEHLPDPLARLIVLDLANRTAGNPFDVEAYRPRTHEVTLVPGRGAIRALELLFELEWLVDLGDGQAVLELSTLPS